MQHTKVNQLLSGRGIGRLLKVRVQAREERGGLGGDAVALIHRLGAVGGVVFAIQLSEFGKEA